MKIERLLLGLFASFLMVGCSQNDDLPNGGEEQGKGLKEYSYIKVNVNSADGFSRAATDGGFEYGDVNSENVIESAHFFFFGENGVPFLLAAENIPSEEWPQGVIVGQTQGNWIYFSTYADGTENTNNPTEKIEEVVSAVMMFKGKTSKALPSSVVVILNWNNTFTADEIANGVSLDNLANKPIATAWTETTSGSSKTYGDFVMSNSVYSDEASQPQAIRSQALEARHCAATKEGAIANPVDIYVERIATKVTTGISPDATLKNGTADVLNTNEEIEYSNNQKDVYAKILSWDINSTNDQSYLLKAINTSWTDATLGFDWNSTTDFRSYWANSIAPKVKHNKEFDINTFKTLGASGYCHENAGDNLADANKTKIIVHAQLQDEDGTALNIAQWMTDYYDYKDLRAVIAASVGELYYSTDKTTYKALAADDGAGLNYVKFISGLEKYPNNVNESYRVYFGYNKPSSGTIYWTRKSDNVTDTDLLTDAEVEAIFANVSPAKVWMGGATYYFTTIEHLGQNFGVVRNHHYKINITGVKGLGTPVHTVNPNNPEPPIDPDYPIIPDPVDPSDTETYLSAQVNVLSWKLVNNNVELGK